MVADHQGSKCKAEVAPSRRRDDRATKRVSIAATAYVDIWPRGLDALPVGLGWTADSVQLQTALKIFVSTDGGFLCSTLAGSVCSSVGSFGVT